MTNTTPIGAYRGAGRPEATAAIERAMDLFAAEIGVDPAEVRRRNLVSRTPFPYTTATGFDLRQRRLRAGARTGVGGAGYAGLRAEQARRRAAGGAKQIGIGVSTYVEITNGLPDPGEFAVVEVLLTRKGPGLHRAARRTARAT